MSYLDDPGAFQRGDGGALLFSVTGASFITSVGLFTYFFALGDGGSLAGLAIGGFFTFLVMSAIGMFAAFIVGLPLTYLLGRLRLERPWIYPTLGAATGAMVAWLLFGRGTNEALLLAGLGSVPGGIAGLIWWTFHRRYFQEIGD